MIAIIDSGGANIASVKFALERLGVEAFLTDDAEKIQKAERVILPGVGEAKTAMDHLNRKGLVEVIKKLTQPVIGICLGMQLLFDHSEERDCKMLGIISGNVTRFRAGQGKTIPHMGWNDLSFTSPHPLLKDLPASPAPYCYFVHSYFAPVSENTVASCAYDESFSAIVAKDNFMGCQFHPERSGKVGAQILKNFMEIPL